MPWSVVEEIAGVLAMMAAASMDYFFSTWCSFNIPSGVMWFYLLVLAPGISRAGLSTAWGNFVIDGNGNVAVLLNKKNGTMQYENWFPMPYHGEQP